MATFAKSTTVPVEKTRAEIETILRRYKADGFAYAYQASTGHAQIEFIAAARRIRFALPMPDRKQRAFTHDKRGYQLVPASQERNWEQACRQRWRALLLAIKAKLEAVECGISEFESEFLANIVDPVTNRTVMEVMRPQIAANYEGRPQQLLLGSST